MVPSDYTMYYTVDATAAMISVAVRVRAFGWVAVGFNAQDDSHRLNDLVIGWISGDGSIPSSVRGDSDLTGSVGDFFRFVVR